MAMNQKKTNCQGYSFLAESFQCFVLRPEASVPSQNSDFDAAWDMTLIARDENRDEDVMNSVNKFRTGISVKPPQGYHFEIIAKPVLSSLGYMLANGTVLLERDDESEIIVPLIKFANTEDIELPCSFLQLVLRKTVHAHIVVKNIGSPSDIAQGYGKKMYSGGSSSQKKKSHKKSSDKKGKTPFF